MPGSSTQTCTPVCPTSKRSVSDIPSTPCLAAAYIPSQAPATRPASELTFTIFPAPRARIDGSTAFAIRHCPSTFVSNCRHTCASETSSIGP